MSDKLLERGDQQIKLKGVVPVSILVSAQVSQAQNFKLMRYDEDYSALKDSGRTFYNRIKYIPLSQSGRTYLSLGGEVRGEVDRAQHEDWGASNTGRNIFVLQRYHLHADLHLGERIHFFGQLRSDFISGDDVKGDGKLGTFNALYPNGGYFGMNPQAGPGNLLSLHPNVAWRPVKNVLFSLETVFYWRQSLQDGIYRPDGTFHLSSSGSAKRYIGTVYLMTVSRLVNRLLNFNICAQYFETGDFINEAIPQHKDGFFIGAQ